MSWSGSGVSPPTWTVAPPLTDHRGRGSGKPRSNTNEVWGVGPASGPPRPPQSGAAMRGPGVAEFARSASQKATMVTQKVGMRPGVAVRTPGDMREKWSAEGRRLYRASIQIRRLTRTLLGPSCSPPYVVIWEDRAGRCRGECDSQRKTTDHVSGGSRGGGSENPAVPAQGTLQNTAGRRRAMGRSIPMPIMGLSQALERARTEQDEIVRVVSS